jgi:UDP-N-acetyl-D-galactosamine dehydrogenase
MTTVAVIGLGYVGLPLAVAFSGVHRTVGYDLSHEKVADLRSGIDPAGQISREDLRAATRLECTTDPAVLGQADFIIVAVPTPVDSAHQPDFSPLIGATETCARHMRKGAVVVYESTVYPGATEEVCLPVLERVSGMKWRRDFHIGYSPERINPGDKRHTLVNITKIVSGGRR